MRLVLAASLVTLAACNYFDDADAPLQTRENVFVYAKHAQPGTTVFVRTARGGITVTPSADDSLRVYADAKWPGTGDPMEGVSLSAVGVTTAAGEGTLICATWGRNSQCTVDNYQAELKGPGRRTRVHFRVEVPSGVKLNLVGIDAPILSSSTAPVVAHTVNGDVTVATAVGPVDAVTLNGSVDIRMTTVEGTDSIIATTLNGQAMAYLPESIAASVDASVANGALVTDFPALQSAFAGQKSARLSLGAGTIPVRVKSLNGRVGVHRLDSQGRPYVTP